MSILEHQDPVGFKCGLCGAPLARGELCERCIEAISDTQPPKVRPVVHFRLRVYSVLCGAESGESSLKWDEVSCDRCWARRAR